MMSNELLTAGQVADMAGVHRVTVHHWAKDGKLPVATTAGGIRLFARSEVEALIERRTEEVES